MTALETDKTTVVSARSTERSASHIVLLANCAPVAFHLHNRAKLCRSHFFVCGKTCGPVVGGQNFKRTYCEIVLSRNIVTGEETPLRHRVFLVFTI